MGGHHRVPLRESLNRSFEMQINLGPLEWPPVWALPYPAAGEGNFPCSWGLSILLCGLLCFCHFPTGFGFCDSTYCPTLFPQPAGTSFFCASLFTVHPSSQVLTLPLSTPLLIWTKLKDGIRPRVVTCIAHACVCMWVCKCLPGPRGSLMLISL